MSGSSSGESGFKAAKLCYGGGLFWGIIQGFRNLDFVLICFVVGTAFLAGGLRAKSNEPPDET